MVTSGGRGRRRVAGRPPLVSTGVRSGHDPRRPRWMMGEYGVSTSTTWGAGPGAASCNETRENVCHASAGSGRIASLTEKPSHTRVLYLERHMKPLKSGSDSDKSKRQILFLFPAQSAQSSSRKRAKAPAPAYSPRLSTHKPPIHTPNKLKWGSTTTTPSPASRLSSKLPLMETSKS